VLRYPRPMFQPSADPRTEDTIVFDVLRSRGDGAEADVVGRAVFRGGRSTVEAPDDVRIAIEELLARAFVDRVQADERPRGYRRSGHGTVERLVPGMPEHFIARLRGLWLSYPDGSVVTAREGGTASTSALVSSEAGDTSPPVTDATTRRATLAAADRTVNAGPLVRAHPPETGLRPLGAIPTDPTAPLSRSDCGWLV
jgi:hypothetical protein